MKTHALDENAIKNPETVVVCWSRCLMRRLLEKKLLDYDWVSFEYEFIKNVFQNN